MASLSRRCLVWQCQTGQGVIKNDPGVQGLLCDAICWQGKPCTLGVISRNAPFVYMHHFYSVFNIKELLDSWNERVRYSVNLKRLLNILQRGKAQQA